MKIYVIGSLRNEAIPRVAIELRKAEFDAFDAWYSAGPDADDYWRDHEKMKGSTYTEALAGDAAQHVYHFDKHHLDECDAAVLVYPAGKSAHLELGYIIGQGKPGFVLLDQEPERYDVMLNFATKVVVDMPSLLAELHGIGPQYDWHNTRPVFQRYPGQLEG